MLASRDHGYLVDHGGHWKPCGIGAWDRQGSALVNYRAELEKSTECICGLEEEQLQTGRHPLSALITINLDMLFIL